MEKRFELALLLQSVVMIGAQLLLLELVVRLRSQAVEFNPEGYTFMGKLSHAGQDLILSCRL